MKEPFIETVGEGSYHEKIEFYQIELNLQVKATEESKALEEVFKLRDETVVSLKKSGLLAEEIVDGSHNTAKWYYQKKSAKYAIYKIIVRNSSQEAIRESVLQLEPLFQNPRFELKSEMNQPIYANADKEEQAAIKEAYVHGLKKARVLADISDLKLGSMIEAQELNKAKRNSGATGDEDWWGDSARFGGGLLAVGSLSADGNEDVSTKSPERTIWIRYRFKFQVMP